jgi:ribonuclease T1
MVMTRKRSPLILFATALALFIGALWQQRVHHDVPAPINAPAPAPASAAPSETRWPRVQQLVAEDEGGPLLATLTLIERGGPFPFERDGVTFANREGRLPAHERGYYREYTVPTAGAQNRGARRVVQGRGGDTWYTNDHYESFVRIDE